MGLFSNVLNIGYQVISASVRIVTESVKAVGKVIVNEAKDFLKTSIETLKNVISVLDTIGKVLDILTGNENVEILGDKAMKADKKMEDFDSANRYIEYLRNEIKTSQEELKKLPLEERLARRAVGSALLSKAISEKKSLEIPVEFWKESVEAGLNAKEIDYFLDKFKKAGIAPVDFAKYLKRELNGEKESKIDNFLLENFKELEPKLDTKEIEEKIVRLQNNG